MTASSAAPSPPTRSAGRSSRRRIRRGGRSPLLRDAFITIVTRFGLAILIFATDIALARLLGPSAKGRFALVLLYSQLAALIVGWGWTRRSRSSPAGTGRRHARGWPTRSSGPRSSAASAVLVSLLAVRRAVDRPGRTGRCSILIPNLSAAQFTYAALALPGELFFAIGLFALLGRKRVVPYSLIRVARRGILLVVIVAIAAIARLSLDVALVLNLVALVVDGGR